MTVPQSDADWAMVSRPGAIVARARAVVARCPALDPVRRLFVAQMLGMDLGLAEQVGAAGIPEAGLVTMALVSRRWGSRPSTSPLLAVDWFLDRCRTTINVLGGHQRNGGRREPR